MPRYDISKRYDAYLNQIDQNTLLDLANSYTIIGITIVEYLKQLLEYAYSDLDPVIYDDIELTRLMVYKYETECKLPFNDIRKYDVFFFDMMFGHIEGAMLDFLSNIRKSGYLNENDREYQRLMDHAEATIYNLCEVILDNFGERRIIMVSYARRAQNGL